MFFGPVNGGGSGSTFIVTLRPRCRAVLGSMARKSRAVRELWQKGEKLMVMALKYRVIIGIVYHCGLAWGKLGRRIMCQGFMDKLRVTL